MSTRAGLRLRLEALREAIEPQGTHIKIEGGLPPPDEAIPEHRTLRSEDLCTTDATRRVLAGIRAKAGDRVRDPKS